SLRVLFVPPARGRNHARRVYDRPPRRQRQSRLRRPRSRRAPRDRGLALRKNQKAGHPRLGLPARLRTWCLALFAAAVPSGRRIVSRLATHPSDRAAFAARAKSPQSVTGRRSLLSQVKISLQSANLGRWLFCTKL